MIFRTIYILCCELDITISTSRIWCNFWMDTTTTLAACGSQVPLDNFLGAWLIGLILASWHGTLCYCFHLGLGEYFQRLRDIPAPELISTQAYLYYTVHSHRDGAFLKSFVGAMVFMDGFHLTLLIMGFYNAVVTNFGDYAALGRPPWTLLVSPLACLGAIVLNVCRRKSLSENSGVLGTMVQTSYAYRVWMLSRSPIIPGFVVLCTWSKLGLGIVYTRRSFELKDAAAKLGVPYSAEPLVKLEVASLSLEMTCDVLISAGMVYALWQNKSEFRRTNRAINTLVAFFVRSGVLNLIFAICSMVTTRRLSIPSFNDSALIVNTERFIFVLGRLYGCSFLSLLNSRDHIREQMSDISHATLSFPASGYRSGAGTDSTRVRTIPEDNGPSNETQSMGPMVFRQDTKSYVEGRHNHFFREFN
ncbi:hypothetical protein C8R45DRAFT_1103905 [Mycena sanguinolenta]|nr:hypothetical protein C8R45DRAFT_1103905 [Mycena sanguinolenta]